MDVAIPLVKTPDPDQLSIALARAATIVSSLEADAKAGSATLHDIKRQREQSVALNSLAKSNASEGTELVNNVKARFRALPSEQASAKLVSDLCSGTQLQVLVTQYCDTHVPTILHSKFDPMQTAIDTCQSSQATFQSNLKTEQTIFVSSIETKLLAIDQRLSDIVTCVKLISDSVTDIKANPVHSQSTNSNMNQGR